MVVNVLCLIPGEQPVFARYTVKVVEFANVPIEANSKIGLAKSGVSEGVGSGVPVETAVAPGLGAIVGFGVGVARKPICAVPSVEFTVVPTKLVT